MDDYSSIVSPSPSFEYGVESSVLGEELDYESDQHAFQDHLSLPDSELSQNSSEGGLFVVQDRRSPPSSVITLSASEHDDHSVAGYHSPVQLPGFEQGLYLGYDEDGFDLGTDIERAFAEDSEVETVSSDSEGTVGQEPHDSPDPLQLVEPRLIDHGGDLDEDHEDYDFEEDPFGDAFDGSEVEDLDEAEDDADFLGLPEPVPYHHHHHHLHHHHFHHPRLPAIHPDRHSPIVLGVNPLQHLGPHLNFLPPHLHEHLHRASASPVYPAASPPALHRMDELVGVELGRRTTPGAGRSSRDRASQNPPQRPRANVIDLTGDDEDADVEIVSGSQNARRQQSQRRSVAPRLNRSDGNYVGHENIIELSSDSEDDVQVNRANAAAPAANHYRHHHHHIHHHHGGPHRHHRGVMDRRSPRRMAGANVGRENENNNRSIFGMAGLAANYMGRVMGFGANPHRDEDVVMIGSSPAAAAILPHLGQIQLDYRAHPFHPPPPAPGPQKPPHLAPPKAREGFTRDIKEDEPVICPSCDEELAFNPDEENESGPPTKKPRTKRDKAEHHFWAVKECGHVSNRRRICIFAILTVDLGVLQKVL